MADTVRIYTRICMLLEKGVQYITISWWSRFSNTIKNLTFKDKYKFDLLSLLAFIIEENMMPLKKLQNKWLIKFKLC